MKTEIKSTEFKSLSVTKTKDLIKISINEIDKGKSSREVGNIYFDKSNIVALIKVLENYNDEGLCNE